MINELTMAKLKKPQSTLTLCWFNDAWNKAEKHTQIAYNIYMHIFPKLFEEAGIEENIGVHENEWTAEDRKRWNKKQVWKLSQNIACISIK